MSGIKTTENFFKIKLNFVEILPKENISSEANPAKTFSPTIAQERKGISDDLQKFLFFRNFNIGENAGDKKTPPSTDPPTYPNAPLFSKGANDTNPIDYDDVSQGSQNNCFLMAAIASIAKNNPQAIDDMINENRDANGNVTSYSVKLYKDGKETTVEVYPSELLSNGANPGDNGEVWVSVIEAAYAKLNGGTGTWSKGGSASEALETLTGKPSENHATDGSDYTFEDLQNDLNAGTNVTLVTPGKEEDKKGKVAGSPYNLNNWHFYTVEKVYVENGVQMVQLYNPWGSDHPKPIPFSELGNYFSQFQTN